MTTTPVTSGGLPPDPADWLDLYVDGLLDEASRVRFEAVLADRADLRAALDSQRRVDASLRTAFAFDPATIRLPGAAGRAADSGRAGVAGRIRPAGQERSVLWQLRWHAAVAAVLIAGALFSLYWNTRGPEVKYLDPAALYARLEAINFTPEFKCTSDAEFVQAVNTRLGSGLLVSSTAEVELLGWAYGNEYDGRIVGPRTLVLMARVGGRDNVVVLMDRKADDRTMRLPEGSKLSLFRRVVGPLVLYEVTPGTTERVLPLAKEATPESCKTDEKPQGPP